MSIPRTVVALLVLLASLLQPNTASAELVASVECSLTPGLHGVTVRATGLERGDQVSIYRSDELLSTIEGFADSQLVFDAFGGTGEEEAFRLDVVRNAEGATIDCGSAGPIDRFPIETYTCSVAAGTAGLPAITWRADATFQLLRDGEPLNIDSFYFFGGPFVDLLAAPNTTYGYALYFSGPFQGEATIDCGTVAVGAIDPAAVAELAAERSSGIVGPYAYATVRLRCPASVECDPNQHELDLWIETLGEGYVLQPGQPLPTLPSAHPGLLVPPEVNQTIVDAIASGSDVYAEFDQRGVPSAWTINGYGLDIICFETDTAPPELRQGPCNPWRFGFRVADATTIEEIIESVDFTQSDADVLRLYDAFFGRRPDLAGAKYWIDQERQGLSADAIAALFIESAEAGLRFDAESDEAFLERVYQNTLDRLPDSAGREYWLGRMQSGLPRSGVVRWFASSEEFVRAYPYQLGAAPS